MPNDPIPVLEIGGTHVTAVLVASDPWELVRESLTDRAPGCGRHPEEMLDELAAAANGRPVGADRTGW